MLRVSTSFSHYSALLNIQQSQSNVNKHLQEVGTGMLGSDLKAFASQAETLIASRNVQVRTETHIANGEALSARLGIQDQALGRVTQGANSAVAAITKALANNDGSTLMAELQSAMDQAVGGLNTTYAGAYLFSGGRTDTAPVSITNIMDLDDPPPLPPAVPPPRPNPFTNGPLPTVSRLNDDITATTGVLADELGGQMFDALADVAAFPDTNFGAPLTADQHDFLQGLLGKMTAASTHATNIQATNGAMQERLEASLEDLKGRKDMVEGMITSVVAADPMEAAARLKQAQTTLQAAAEAFNTLQASSLLNLLSR